MPVWHASVSLRAPDHRLIRAARQVERAAIAELAGVGGDREWWVWCNGVGHLRVAMLASEVAQLPVCGVAVHDAGDSGPERVRTRR